VLTKPVCEKAPQLFARLNLAARQSLLQIPKLFG
jgi:hypothetical protein